MNKNLLCNTCEIQIIIDNQTVTISGTINDQVKALIEQAIVNGLPYKIYAWSKVLMNGPDAIIAETIIKKLLSAKLDSIKTLTIKVHHGLADISGAVFSSFKKRDFLYFIKSIPNVRYVMDGILVSDNKGINFQELAIYNALKETDVIDVNNLQLLLSNGKVTLNGIVRSAAEKEEATMIALSFKGITTVENNLQTENAELTF